MFARLLLKAKILGAVKLPYTAALLVVGILFGIWNHEMDLQELGESFDMWYAGGMGTRAADVPGRPPGGVSAPATGRRRRHRGRRSERLEQDAGRPHLLVVLSW